MWWAWLRYALQCKGVHSLHSPFVFDFYTRVVQGQEMYYAFELIEALREQLRKNGQLLQLKGFGAGSRGLSSRRLNVLLKRASAPPKVGRLLFRSVLYMQAKTIVELGTHLGVGTAYLAMASPSTRVYTLEGEPQLLQLARQNCRALGIQNVEYIEGDINQTLPLLLNRLERVDIAYLDANHYYQPTLQYVEALLPKLHEDSLLIVDDIYWSHEMAQAWKQLCGHPEFGISIDLFRLGLLFCRQKQPKQHFILRF